MAIIKSLQSVNDIQILEDFYSENFDHVVVSATSKSLKLMSKNYETPEFYEKISKIVAPLVGYDDIFTYRYGDFKGPCIAHVDGTGSYFPSVLYSENRKKANTTILIPLSWNPVSGSPSTVFFDQCSHDKHMAQHTAYGWSDDYDYSAVVTDYTNKPFDKDHHKEFLSHEDIDRLYGFSIYETVKWEIGKAIFFESYRLHCSSSFIDITEKRCFLVKVHTDLFD